jgi:hypothetical protein
MRQIRRTRGIGWQRTLTSCMTSHSRIKKSVFGVLCQGCASLDWYFLTILSTWEFTGTFFKNSVLPEEERQSFFFQQDGATCHTSRVSLQRVHDVFSAEWTVIKNLWPPRSPDLTTCNYFVWWHLKSTVYKSNLHMIQELKDNSSHAVAAIRSTILHLVYPNMIRHAWLCIDAGGNRFHHLLWWFILSAFGYCINFCIYTMLQTRATFLWPTLYIVLYIQPADGF